LLACIASETNTGSDLVTVEIVAFFIDGLEPLFPITSISVKVIAHDIKGVGVADLRSIASIIRQFFIVRRETGCRDVEVALHSWSLGFLFVDRFIVHRFDLLCVGDRCGFDGRKALLAGE
jgi:hypothetical protein